MIPTIVIVLGVAFAPLPQSEPDAPEVVVVDDEQTALNRRLYDLASSPDTTAEQLEAVLRAGADPEASAKSVGISSYVGVMYYAAVHLRDPRAIEVLLDAGLTPNRYITQMAVILNSSVEAVACVIEANRIAGTKNPKLGIADPTALLPMAAQRNPNPAVVRLLLASADHDLNEPGALELTPFLLACKDNPNPAVLEALIEAGSDIHFQGGSDNTLTALRLACTSNPNLEVIEFLLDIGCDATAPYPNGRSPYLAAAIAGRHPETFGLLVEHGADPNVTFDSNNALYAIVGINPNDGMLTAALDAGTRLSALGPDGGSILELAVTNSSVDPLATLLDLGVDPNAGDPPPLGACAIVSERPEMVDLLIEAGADPDHRTTSVNRTFRLLAKGSTVLMNAAFNLTEEAAAMLQAVVDTGIDVNATNEMGMTALMLVASRSIDLGKQTVPMIRVLIDAGADPTPTDRWGRTAREIAEANLKLQDVDLDAAFAPPSTKDHR